MAEQSVQHGAGDQQLRRISRLLPAPRADPQVGQPSVTVEGVQGSRAPGAFGGNLDVEDLTAGATLYLPVFHSGTRFYVGDPHGAQGDCEVSGTAIEQSLTGTFRFLSTRTFPSRCLGPRTIRTT